MLKLRTVLVAGVTLLAITSAANAGMAKTYQVTGPVLAVTDDSIVVQKGKEKWELAREAATKVTGDLKVGAKVTIEYRMTATAVEVKTGGAAAPHAAKPKSTKSIAGWHRDV